MASDQKDKRIAELVKRAQHARRRDSNQEAADAVREALSIDPDNEDARKLFEGLSLTGGKATDVLRLCRDYYEGITSDDGFRSAIEGAAIDIEGTRETFEFVFDHKGDRSGRIVERLLSKPNGRRTIIPMLLDEPTTTFRALWDLGEASVTSLVMKVLLQPAAWNKEGDRRKAERDITILLLAKLLEAGQETPELAMLAIARLLAVDVQVLQEVFDPEAYAILFGTLDQTHPLPVRSQATVALAKLHESSPERWETELFAFVESQAQTQKTENLIVACSAVSTLFAVAPPVCAKMFLREGFVQQLMHLVENTNSSKFKEAALELFSAACVDSQCRQTIKKYCMEWLAQMAADQNRNGRQSKLAVIACLVNSKIRDDGKTAGGIDDKLVLTLKNIVLNHDAGDDTIGQAVEGLQYQSVHSKVKENLANDATFLKKLIAFLSKPNVVGNGALIYAGLNIFQNLTRYPLAVSQEQQKIAELKAYANRTPLPKKHPLDEEEPVSDRCTKILDAGIAPLLVLAFKKASVALLTVISATILALSKHPEHRGKMAQQSLFDVSLTMATADLNKQSQTALLKRQSALACARIMIPIDPNLLFKGRDIKPILRVLLFLLKGASSDQDTESDALWWRGFPIVTAVQAITNLATYQPSPGNTGYAGELIIKECWDTLEDLWVSHAIQIRTAVTECFVNLTLSDAGVAKFVLDGERSEKRIRIMCGYWSEEDANLARAAGGALASILGTADQAVELFMKTDSGMKYTVEKLKGGNPELVHRAVVIADETMSPVDRDDGRSNLALVRRVLEVSKEAELSAAIQGVRKGRQLWDEQARHCLDVLTRYNV